MSCYLATGGTAMVKWHVDHGLMAELAFAMANGHRETARAMWEHDVRTSSKLAYAVSQGAPVEGLTRIIDGVSPVSRPWTNPGRRWPSPPTWITSPPSGS